MEAATRQAELALGASLVVIALVLAKVPYLYVGPGRVQNPVLAWTYVLAAQYDGGRRVYLVGWLGNWLPGPAFAVLILLLLLFRNGRLLSHRWRPIAWAAVTWYRDDVPLGRVPRAHRRPAAAEPDRAHR